MLPYRIPYLKGILPEMRGRLRYFQRGIISVCTYLIGSDVQARKLVDKRWLGYRGVVTTLEGMMLELFGLEFRTRRQRR